MVLQRTFISFHSLGSLGFTYSTSHLRQDGSAHAPPWKQPRPLRPLLLRPVNLEPAASSKRQLHQKAEVAKVAVAIVQSTPVGPNLSIQSLQDGTFRMVSDNSIQPTDTTMQASLCQQYLVQQQASNRPIDAL